MIPQNETDMYFDNTAARSALIYAERHGWAVIPLHSIRNGLCTCGRPDCQSPGKHPLTGHGVADATTDASVISGWWRYWPWANIGIATGAASGFFALDIDGEEGEESLRALEDDNEPLPTTEEAITGGGGRHILFAHPGRLVSNKVALAPGLDIRGDGGYIVAAPSFHISGRRYHWEVSSRPGEVALAPAPDWLLAIIGSGNDTAVGQTPEEWRRLVREGVGQGIRNDTIARLAGMLLRRDVDAYVALDLLQAWNAARCRPPLPEDEVTRTVNSVAWAELRRRGGTGGRG